MKNTAKNREQYMREVRKKRAKLIAKRKRKEERLDLIFKGGLGLAGAGVFYLFFGYIGLSLIGAYTLVKKYIEIAE